MSAQQLITEIHDIQQELERRARQTKLFNTIPPKLIPFRDKKKRFKVALGGRGSGKSMTFADLLLQSAMNDGIKTACFREFQNSIDDSVLALLAAEVERLELTGFDCQTTKILLNGKEMFKFRGLARNPEGVKSMHGFKRFWVEEAQTMSQQSLTALTPTLREADSEIWFSANPMSSEDPFSKRFIKPYESELLKNGFYEDDLHLIVWINYQDNPYFPDVLDKERLLDKEIMTNALYNHVWLGEFNDSVESALIDSEWFDACIDAHEKLGFEARGVKIAAHDPSDTGPDSKGYAMRHGSIVLDVQEKETGAVNEGGHWAAGIAIQQGVDLFTWDGDGMGVALSEQLSTDFEGKHAMLSMFRGSEGVDHPNSTYKPAQKGDISDQRTNKNTFRNKRAQYYFALRDRIYLTYRAVKFGAYNDPDKMISFSSDIGLLNKLRAELCRMPTKPNGNGLFELYTKDEMKRKFKIASPNLADSVMMLMRAVRTAKRRSQNTPRVSIV